MNFSLNIIPQIVRHTNAYVRLKMEQSGEQDPLWYDVTESEMKVYFGINILVDFQVGKEKVVNQVQDNLTHRTYMDMNLLIWKQKGGVKFMPVGKIEKRLFLGAHVQRSLV